MIVVDTSVIIAVIGNEPHKNKIIERTIGEELIAPQSVHWEICNAFSAMLKRKIITLNEALCGLDEYRNIPVRYADVELKETLRIAAELNIYAYDAYILRCSIKYNAALITLDKSLMNLARNIKIDVIEVTL